MQLLHLHNGILVGHKKKEILPLFETAWMDLESIMVSEISQTNTVLFQLYVESNEQINRQPNINRLRDTENRLTAVRGRGLGG